VPELPEVESLRRDLSRTIVGRTITAFELRVPKLFQSTYSLTFEGLLGRRVDGLHRRAKFLIWDLSDELALVMHLGLAGQLVHVGPEGSVLAHGGHPVPMWGARLPHRATHATFRFEDDSLLYLTDIRQFSRLWLLVKDDLERFFYEGRLGPEPLSDEFTADKLAAKLRRRGVPIKTVLLDQTVIGGIGNIYADESLWEARVHPKRPAASLSDTEIDRLHAAVRFVLEYAIREGVAFVPQGKALSDRDFPYCHGRAGSPCFRCGARIQKEWIGGRGSYWCPGCQQAPDAHA
jgi:formamidopyrimidine-DNA glycosylase